MAKSAKQRMLEYRQRKKENPEACEQHKASERERWRERKENGK